MGSGSARAESQTEKKISAVEAIGACAACVEPLYDCHGRKKVRTASLGKLSAKEVARVAHDALAAVLAKDSSSSIVCAVTDAACRWSMVSGVDAAPAALLEQLEKLYCSKDNAKRAAAARTLAFLCRTPSMVPLVFVDGDRSKFMDALLSGSQTISAGA